MLPVPRPGDSSTRSEQASASASIGASNGFMVANVLRVARLQVSGSSSDSTNRARVIPCEPKTPASSWSDALRASCGSNSYPGRLCSKIASTQIGVGQGQSDHCTCRIGVCQFSLTLERTSAILTNCSPHRYQRRRAFRGNVVARQKPRALI